MDWLGRQRRRLRREESVLVEEAMSFLTGHLATHVASNGSPMPAWARVNSLGHARPSQLVDELALRQRRLPEQLGSWARTEFDILAELVKLASGELGRMERLQRECLVPLEFRLMQPSLRDALPNEVLILALTRLRAHPVAMQYREASPPDSWGTRR